MLHRSNAEHAVMENEPSILGEAEPAELRSTAYDPRRGRAAARL